MDFEINEAVESAYRIEREYGFLCDNPSRMGATFAAVLRLAETEDLAVIDGWLRPKLSLQRMASQPAEFAR
jgi:hypothetical protein